MIVHPQKVSSRQNKNIKYGLKILAAGLFLALSWFAPATAAEVDLYCWVDNGPPIHWAPCNTSTPLVIGSGPYAFTPLTPGQYTPVSDSASTALTVPAGATYAVVCAESANHRYTWDNTTTPTASVGAQLLQNQCVSFSGALVLAAVRIITQKIGRAHV
jgi:hypothetical protein